MGITYGSEFQRTLGHRHLAIILASPLIRFVVSGSLGFSICDYRAYPSLGMIKPRCGNLPRDYGFFGRG